MQFKPIVKKGRVTSDDVIRKIGKEKAIILTNLEITMKREEGEHLELIETEKL